MVTELCAYIPKRGGSHVDYFVVTNCTLGGRGDYLKSSQRLTLHVVGVVDCLSFSAQVYNSPIFPLAVSSSNTTN